MDGRRSVILVAFVYTRLDTSTCHSIHLLTCEGEQKALENVVTGDGGKNNRLLMSKQIAASLQLK